MLSVGRDLNNHLIPNPLPRAGTPSSRGVNYSSFITCILALSIGRRKKNMNKIRNQESNSEEEKQCDQMTE